MKAIQVTRLLQVRYHDSGTETQLQTYEFNWRTDTTLCQCLLARTTSPALDHCAL